MCKTTWEELPSNSITHMKQSHEVTPFYKPESRRQNLNKAVLKAGRILRRPETEGPGDTASCCKGVGGSRV